MRWNFSDGLRSAQGLFAQSHGNRDMTNQVQGRGLPRDFSLTAHSLMKSDFNGIVRRLAFAAAAALIPFSPARAVDLLTENFDGLTLGQVVTFQSRSPASRRMDDDRSVGARHGRRLVDRQYAVCPAGHRGQSDWRRRVRGVDFRRSRLVDRYRRAIRTASVRQRQRHDRRGRS